MDSFNFYNIKAEKANAILRYNQLRKIANLFRFVEILVVIVLISRLSFHVPVAVKNSGGFFRDFSGILSSPRFVFVLGNVIVITLFAKSGQFSGRDSGKKFPGYDLYDEFVKNSEKNQKVFSREKVENRAKHGISENPVVVVAGKCTDQCMEIKSYKRSISEIVERPRKPNRVLKRSETENFAKRTEHRERSDKGLYPEDAMSSEEFRLKVEAFIARQQRFRMEEEYSGNVFE
ncbi:tRNA-methyltransferase non-catalytic subunit trm6MTase subunit [Parasponia andersonii]|uniref:tRNA-methyltransferase non-catalytic subunit trm6MTase subunit n=1 Tax=Parasponia andersonii TaxID=3476 RepID=A0A2P5CVU2_PARAD|nr:tRNA-methyltransferase non-catalytic subunit trm6MTase subunit [Parasponia andersonii]